ncbi:MAG TPA: hypothetical protein VH353_00290 [Caulobacteraceae bacterium]|jgi:hypothetical protein|nr:hypothetical protein [Caulobacteraceae bacterium]
MSRYVLAASIVVVSLAGCTPPHPHASAGKPLRQISALTCPQEQGDLQLKPGSESPRSCVYATDDGDTVTLQLVDLNGADPDVTLRPMEAQLASEVPEASRDAGTPAPSPSGHDRVDIDLPGLHIHTRDDGQASVDTAGVHVLANDDHGSGAGQAQVSVAAGDRAGVKVNAHEGGAQIRVNESGPGIRRDYVLQSETPGPNGFRLAAYEVRGPAGGPVVVARILGKDSDADELRHDVRRLLQLNVGG